MKTEQKSQPGTLPTAKEATNRLEIVHSKAIRGACQVIIDKTMAVGTAYMQLCTYIRKNAVAPKLVSHEMTEMGFNRQVISRVNKVANSADAVWNSFEARLIGFNKALALSRSPVVDAMATETKTSVTDVKAQIEELEQSEESQGRELIEPTAEEKEQKAEKSIQAAASRLLSAAASLGIKKERKFSGDNGYVVIVKVAPKPSAPKTTAEKTAKE